MDFWNGIDGSSCVNSIINDRRALTQTQPGEIATQRMVANASWSPTFLPVALIMFTNRLSVRMIAGDGVFKVVFFMLSETNHFDSGQQGISQQQFPN